MGDHAVPLRGPWDSEPYTGFIRTQTTSLSFLSVLSKTEAILNEFYRPRARYGVWYTVFRITVVSQTKENSREMLCFLCHKNMRKYFLTHLKAEIYFYFASMIPHRNTFAWSKIWSSQVRVSQAEAHVSLDRLWGVIKRFTHDLSWRDTETHTRWMNKGIKDTCFQNSQVVNSVGGGECKASCLVVWKSKTSWAYLSIPILNGAIR